jgi:hypothetical protein
MWGQVTSAKGVIPPSTTFHPLNSSSNSYPQSPLEGVRFFEGVSTSQQHDAGDEGASLISQNWRLPRRLLDATI